MEPIIIVGASSWIWWLILPFLAWLLLTQILYMVRQYRSVGWPFIDATIQKGPTGFVPIGRGEGTPACFVGYAFQLNGSTYTGLFALYGSRDDVERVRENFSGGLIRVRYNPANPSISYLNELNDPRFGRLTPTQNPQHLPEAPSFDLQDIIGN
jgi:hypothetical protein